MDSQQARATKKQQQLLEFVTNFISDNNYGPSYREIMKALDYKSVSTVAVHVEGLIAKGFLRRADNSPRSLEVITRASSNQTTNIAHIQTVEDVFTQKITELYKKSDENIETQDNIEVLLQALDLLGHQALASRLRRPGQDPR